MEYAIIAIGLVLLALGVRLWQKWVDLDHDDDDEDYRYRRRRAARHRERVARAARGPEMGTSDDARELQAYERRLMDAPIFDNRNDRGHGVGANPF